jgi:outer membrane protein OmpA-like peptidoglycan-associated protein
MKMIPTSLARTLQFIVGIFALLLGTADAEDCNKAKEIYAAGTKLLNFQERANAFQKAVNLCPSFADAHVNLADAFENLAMLSKDLTQKNLAMNNKFLDMAIKEYQEALKIKSNLFVAHLGLAENYTRIGLYAKAKESYQNALAAEPNNRLASRAQAGLQSIERAIAEDKDGFKKSQEIVQRFKQSSKDPAFSKLMGFEDFTAVKDRQRFINIVFDEWSNQLNRKETITQLEEIGKALSSSDLARCQFIVEGHTDPRGGEERNQKLSWDRAEAVKSFLVSRFNIDGSKITTQGFGYDRPRFPNDSPDNMLRNRRVELLIAEQTDQ